MYIYIYIYIYIYTGECMGMFTDSTNPYDIKSTLLVH